MTDKKLSFYFNLFIITDNVDNISIIIINIINITCVL